jgi:hypothetical protein
MAATTPLPLRAKYRLQRERYPPALAYVIARLRHIAALGADYKVPPGFHLHTEYRGRAL